MIYEITKLVTTSSTKIADFLPEENEQPTARVVVGDPSSITLLSSVGYSDIRCVRIRFSLAALLVL